MISASNVPDCDSALRASERKAECYCNFFISSDKEGKQHLTKSQLTPFRWNCSTPYWNSFRRLRGKMEEGTTLYLILQLFDHDLKSKDDFIGQAFVPIESMKLGAETKATIELTKSFKAHKGDVTVSFSLGSFDTAKYPSKKTFFLIRHGESKWNEGEHMILKEKKVFSGALQMASGRDHPLNHNGILQARALRKRWTAVAQDSKADFDHKTGPKPTGKDIEKFLNAQKIYASPLTRALQTCLLALEGHTEMKKSGVQLVRQLREVKNRIGWDALGKECGDKVMLRVRSEMEAEAKLKTSELGTDLKPEDVEPCCDVAVDVSDAMSMWWDPDKDDKHELKERFQDVVNFLRFSPYETAICVGHSLFFRELMRRFVGKKMEQSEAEFVPILKKSKLGNGACVMVEFDFSSPEYEQWEIVQAKMMFGSVFKKQKEPQSGKNSPKASEASNAEDAAE